MDMEQKKYVITAVNRKTGEREAVTKPHLYDVAYAQLLKIQNRRSGDKVWGYKAMKYKHPKMEPYQEPNKTEQL